MAILTPYPKNGFSRQSCNLIYIRTKLIWFLTVFKRYSWHVYIQSAWKKISTRKCELKSFWNKWKGGGVYDNSSKDTRRKKNLLTFGELTHSITWRTRWVDALDELMHSMSWLIRWIIFRLGVRYRKNVTSFFFFKGTFAYCRLFIFLNIRYQNEAQRICFYPYKIM